MLSLASVLVLFMLKLGVLGSDITTYTDVECMKSFSNLRAVNGYPDGVCTPLELSKPETFQLAKLDDGCAVTLYGENEGPLSCSSSLKIVAQMGTCYNTSWVYYSIDGCLQPRSSSLILPTSTPIPTPVSVPSSTISVASATATISEESEPRTNRTTGAIVGGITGSVASFAVIFGIVLCLRRRYQEKPLPAPPSHEHSNDSALMEAGRGSLMSLPKAPIEMSAHEATMEIGRNSGFVFRAELPADPAFGDKKALHEYVRAEDRDSTSSWI
ncbi:hypothetical protein P280DRAFT_387981 [Massarina eburnea CBS 473.64]|uniref:Uncharacterized protein n=1 Tax=Massarina eburnea CBS 473.64 TaxID=1395130 RepID=A0A6A6SF65_9PLEO|nr:hypothetical protein P280DRAFT_387981 [Massarina eburnea CBS 473.64]